MLKVFLYAVVGVLVFLFVHFKVNVSAGCDPSGCGGGCSSGVGLPNPQFQTPSAIQVMYISWEARCNHFSH